MPPKKKAIGKPLQWTDEQLDEMSRITAEDVERAAARWREVTSPKYKLLLDAEETNDEPAAQ